MPRVHRRAARVLPVSAAGEVLLVQFTDPGRPNHAPHWVSVGGGIDPGEDAADAAVRELWEETGIRIDPDQLVGPVHREAHDFSWNGGDYTADSTYFAMPLGAEAGINFDNLEEAEVGYLLQAGWWTPDALRADGTAASDDLPEIMEIAIDAVRGVQ